METNCTDIEMRKVLNRALLLVPYPDSNNGISQNEVSSIIKIVCTNSKVYNHRFFMFDSILSFFCSS